MFVKKGMTVRVLSGNHKGSEGKVLQVIPKSNRVLIEGVNFIKRATRPSQENQAGGFVEKEAPIHISNVMVIHGGQASRLGNKVLDDGTKVRFSKKTGQEIEI